MYKYDLSEKAKEDLFRIYEFGIAKFGVSQADKYFDMMHECFTKIAMYPFYFLLFQMLKLIIASVFAELMLFFTK